MKPQLEAQPGPGLGSAGPITPLLELDGEQQAGGRRPTNMAVRQHSPRSLLGMRTPEQAGGTEREKKARPRSPGP